MRNKLDYKCDGNGSLRREIGSGAVCGNMVGLEIIVLGGVGQTEKNKYHMISLICGIEF